MVGTRSDNDRRSKIDLRVFNDPNYKGPERRSGSNRRPGNDRRKISLKSPISNSKAKHF